MPESVDTDWAKGVLSWWIEHGDAALSRSLSSSSFCAAGPATAAMLERELQTRQVISVVLGIQEVGALIVQLRTGSQFVELQARY
jgi:hypothetical protein